MTVDEAKCPKCSAKLVSLDYHELATMYACPHGHHYAFLGPDDQYTELIPASKPDYEPADPRFDSLILASDLKKVMPAVDLSPERLRVVAEAWDEVANSLLNNDLIRSEYEGCHECEAEEGEECEAECNVGATTAAHDLVRNLLLDIGQAVLSSASTEAEAEEGT